MGIILHTTILLTFFFFYISFLNINTGIELNLGNRLLLVFHTTSEEGHIKEIQYFDLKDRQMNGISALEIHLNIHVFFRTTIFRNSNNSSLGKYFSN